MKRTGVFCLLVIFCFAAFFGLSQPAAKATVNYNRLIDDFVFSNSGKMSAAQIDAFLNTQPNSCISTNKGFKAPEPTGYTPTKSFSYGSNVSAGQVIYVAAKAYGLNPQVLLTTIQKEQGYVVGPGSYDCSDPLSSSAKKGYAQIAGYGCPDGGKTYSYSGVNLYTIGSTTVTSVSGTCVNSKSKAGFSQQIIRAAWLLKFGQQRSLGNTGWNVQLTNFPHNGDVWDNSDDPSTCYGGPMTQGYRKRCSTDAKTTFYDGYTTIDGSSVHMDTGATAALYWYTPHKNGNLNFYNIFTSWFGSTLTNPIKLTYVSARSSESGGTALVEYSLVQQPTDNVTIPLAVSDSSEATLNGVASLVITPSNWNKPQNNKVIIMGLDDSEPDGDVSYSLIAGKPSSSDPAFDNLSSADAPNADLINDDNEPDFVLVGDWDGDGKKEIGLKRGNTYYLDYNNDGHSEVIFKFGVWSDTALVGDWNGSHKDHIALKRGSRYYMNYDNRGTTNAKFDFGLSTDTPLVGDWDGDGKDDIAVHRGQRYYLNYDHRGTTNAKFDFGLSTDTPLVGDWDGDGKDDIAVHRGQRYYLNYDHRGTTNAKFDFGLSTDTPLVGDWDGDKKTEVGIKRSNKYYLTYDNNNTAEATFYFGR